jgi:thiol-disulfide isomerase/thioredoxin
MVSRRNLLRTAGVAALAGFAGCSAVLGEGSDDDPGLQLDTIDVAGSPGGPITVRPPNVVALLDFWATWCAPCKPQMAELRRIRETFPDLHMLSITNETDVEAIKSFWQTYEGTWPVATDPDLETNERYGVRRIPTLIVLDAAGTEQWRHVGLAAAESVANALREADG